MCNKFNAHTSTGTLHTFTHHVNNASYFMKVKNKNADSIYYSLYREVNSVKNTTMNIILNIQLIEQCFIIKIH